MSADNPFDLAGTLERYMGDEELLREVVTMYFAEMPRLLAEMTSAVASRDAHGLERCAHTVKSLVAGFGATQAAGTALALETAGRLGGWDQVPSLLLGLEKDLQALSSALSLYRQKSA